MVYMGGYFPPLTLPLPPRDAPDSGLIAIKNHRVFKIYTRKDCITTTNYFKSFFCFKWKLCFLVCYSRVTDRGAVPLLCHSECLGHIFFKVFVPKTSLSSLYSKVDIPTQKNILEIVIPHLLLSLPGKRDFSLLSPFKFQQQGWP